MSYNLNDRDRRYWPWKTSVLFLRTTLAIVAFYSLSSCSSVQRLNAARPQAVPRPTEKMTNQFISLRYRPDTLKKEITDEILRLAYVHVFGKEHYYNKFQVRINPKGKPSINMLSTDNGAFEINFEMPVSAVTTLDRGFLNQRSEVAGSLLVSIYSEVQLMNSNYGFRSKAYLADLSLVDYIGPYMNNYGGGRLLRDAAFGTNLSDEIGSILNKSILIKEGVNEVVTRYSDYLNENLNATNRSLYYRVTGTSYINDTLSVGIITRGQLVFKKEQDQTKQSDKISPPPLKPDNTLVDSAGSILISKKISLDSLNSNIHIGSSNTVQSLKHFTIVKAGILPYDSLFLLDLYVESDEVSGRIYLYGELLEVPGGNLKFSSLTIHESSRAELKKKVPDFNPSDLETFLTKNTEVRMTAQGLSTSNKIGDNNWKITFTATKGAASHVEGDVIGSTMKLIIFKIGMLTIQANEK